MQLLLKPQLLVIAGTPVTDHNRSPVSVSVERIEHSVRTANGTLRKYHVADKRSFSVSWEMLPTHSNQTIDKHAGAIGIRNLYLNNKGAFTLSVRNRDGSLSSFNVHFTSCNWEVVKRWKTTEYWNIDIEMEQI